MGVPLPGSTDPTEGSFIDRWFYLLLGCIGIYILSKRKIDWASILKENAWLFSLFAFMLLSIAWSYYPVVSMKRLIKSFCAVIMVMVVLTEQNPLAAITAVIRRCAYFHIPLSIIVIRYFRHIGIDWDWSGDAESWIGIATSKNTLGQIAMVSAIIFIWERIQGEKDKAVRRIDILYILMSLYLLKGSDDAVSMTSVSVFIVALFIFSMLRLMKSHMSRIKPFIALGCIAIFTVLLAVILHSLNPASEDSFLGAIVRLMGRDPTLTGRTEIWQDVYEVASRSPLVGVGFGAFWIGRLVNIPWTENLTWTLGQAHNGYVDTYLQLGWVGIVLLFAVFLSAIPGMVRTFREDFDYGLFRSTLFLVILFVNITETTFLRGEHQMWFLFLIAIISIPQRREQPTAAPSPPLNARPRSGQSASWSSFYR
ncbi:MAG TPA: O-antigen ligase family protein [Syntrophales bacterium]|nr:O-antigen ligase family protein [Syntrophales bacterium]HQN78062.1 O-antigen ligase family protein [Syntrophales bacterium]